MAKVTGRLQITLSKALAERCGIRVGDEVELRAVGQSIQIDKRVPRDASRSRRDRMPSFDEATARQGARDLAAAPVQARGWTRKQLCKRGRPR